MVMISRGKKNLCSQSAPTLFVLPWICVFDDLLDWLTDICFWHSAITSSGATQERHTLLFVLCAAHIPNREYARAFTDRSSAAEAACTKSTVFWELAGYDLLSQSTGTDHMWDASRCHYFNTLRSHWIINYLGEYVRLNFLNTAVGLSSDIILKPTSTQKYPMCYSVLQICVYDRLYNVKAC